MTTTTAPAGPASPPGPPAAPSRQVRRAVPREARGRAGRAPTAWVDAAVLGGTVAVATLPLVPVFGPRAALPAVAGGAALGAVLAASAARRAWGGLVTLAAAVVAYLLLGPVLAAPTVAWAGVLPSPASTTELLRAVVAVWKEVATLDPELGASAALLAAPFLLGLSGAAAAVSLAARAPRGRGAWAALVPIAVLGVALLLGTTTTVLPVPAAAVLALALTPWAAWHRGTLAPRRGVALAFVAVAVLGGAVAGPFVVADQQRFVLRDQISPPFDPREHPSPLSAFRSFVKQWHDTELVTVRGLPEGARVRLATMDAFDGVVWNVAGSEQAEGSGGFRRVGETITAPFPGVRARVEIEVHELPMVWLPTVGWAERIAFAGPAADDLARRLRYNDATGAAVLTGGIPAGTRWTADVVVPPVPDDSDLADVAAADLRLPQPVGVPEAVPAYAGEIARAAASPAEIARSLAEGLAERGYFSHGVLPGEEPSLSGHGADRVTTLLTGDLMVGDGEQYASAMALMAREMGLPARVVLGFVADADAGDGPVVDGAREVTLTGRDVQAWVEVRYAGHGWVAYDPTPDESRTPRADDEERHAAEDPQVRQPPPPLTEPVDPPDDDTEQPRTRDQDEVPVADDDWRQVLLVAGLGSLPVVLLVGPLVAVVAAKRRRRRRRRDARDPVRAVAGGWDEVLDEARDLRHPVPSTATRRETAVHLAAAFPRSTRHGTVGAAVAGLAAGADAVVFGPGDPPAEHVAQYWRQVAVARAAMRAAVPRRRRWRARLATASLRHRRRLRRAARAARAGRGPGTARTAPPVG